MVGSLSGGTYNNCMSLGSRSCVILGFPRGASDILPVLQCSQLRPVVIYRRFGVVCRSNLQMSSSLILEDDTDRLSRNVGN
jgi:hypothetical protein